MKKVVVEIECNKKTCGGCEWCDCGELYRFCSLYNVDPLEWDERYISAYRCKQCLEAEVKDEEKSSCRD
jgi:hypothetical protein